MFLRLSRGENRLLSRNGPDEDAELFRQVESGEEDACRAYFAVLGFRLERGDGCYYFFGPKTRRQGMWKTIQAYGRTAYRAVSAARSLARAPVFSKK